MRFVRFLAKSYCMDRIYEKGEEGLIPDYIPLGRHMVDIRAETEAMARGELDAPTMVLPPKEPDPVPLINRTMDAFTPLGRVHVDATEHVAQTVPAAVAQAVDQPREITTPEGKVLVWNEEQHQYVVKPGT